MNVIDPVLAYRAELRSAASRGVAVRRRLLTVLAVAVVGILTAGLSLAGTGWLTGEAAPPDVVSDFHAYAPQLGFHPDPGKAVLVAHDGSIKLYATTNREGTYCLVVDEPWKPASAGDGGSCIDEKAAAKPVTAWVIGLSAISKDGEATMVVAGRVDRRDIRTIRFDDPDGVRVERPVGASGFYVAAVRAEPPVAIVRPEGVRCPTREWTPTFEARSESGKVVWKATIPLLHSRACESDLVGPR